MAHLVQDKTGWSFSDPSQFNQSWFITHFFDNLFCLIILVFEYLHFVKKTRLSFAYIRLLLLEIQLAFLFACGCLWWRILHFLHLSRRNFFLLYIIIILQKGESCVMIVTLIWNLQDCWALVCGQIWSLPCLNDLTVTLSRKGSRTFVRKHYWLLLM